MTTPRIIPDGIPFTQYPNDAITDPALDSYAVNVLLYLFMRANAESRTWPSQRTIAKHVGIGRNKVIAALAVLESEGWISIRLAGKDPDAPVEHKQKHSYVVHGTRPERLFPPEPVSDSNRYQTATGSPQDTTGAPHEPEPVSEARHNNKQIQHPEQHPPLSTTQRRDLLWETITEIHGQPATKTERGKYNKYVKDLRDADVTPDEYPTLVAAFLQKWSKRTGTLQPTLATIATRVGELRHYNTNGPMESPNGTAAAATERRREAQIIARDAQELPA